jgi:glycosyltransferase involved in cell wall biosynthesis
VVSVWIFVDLPLGHAAGPSYMVESWQRELGRLGLAPRTFAPDGEIGGHQRDAAGVTFRSLRDVGYPGDHHALYSALVEVIRARRQRPQAIVVSTLGRVGLLGIILSAVYSIPLVMVVSTDTTGATAYYSAIRAVGSGGIKPLLLLALSRRARAAFFRRPVRSGHETAGLPGRLVARTTSAIYADASEVVLLSSKGLRTYGTVCPDAPVTVLPTGIDRLPAAPVPPELVWRPGALRVLYVGRFAPEKNIPLLLHALRAAVDDGVDAQLALVGEGPLRERLVVEAERLGVADRLTVLGPYPRRDLGGIYASADVFAFPSVVDTQAYVLNEAAHERLALLVSDTVNGVVEDGVSAIVVPPDPARYAEALSRLRDPRLRERLGTAARQRAEQLGEGVQSARLADIILRAAGATRPAPEQRTTASAGSGAGASTQDGLTLDSAVTGGAPTR